MMNCNRLMTMPMLLAAALLLTLLLSGCGAVPGNVKATAAPAVSTSTAGSDSTSGAEGKDAGQSTASPAAPAPDSFASSFKTVDRNPLNENIQYALWAAANATPAPGDTSVGVTGSVLTKLLDKYAALVAGTGVHYTQTTTAVGMKMISEVWMKGGKFKVVDQFMGEVKIFDGETFVKYDSTTKRGMRYTKELMAGEIDMQLNGSVRSNAAPMYKQKADEKFGKFDCNVFFMEMNAMGIKSVTIYVDKATGMVVNYLTDGDELMKSTITVSKLVTGGFGDEVFAVPDGITIDDYK